jgi:uncharacterized membrane protein
MMFMWWLAGTYGPFGVISILIILVLTIICTLVTEFVMNKITHGNNSQYVRNRILFWLFLISLICIIFYAAIGYTIDPNKFTEYNNFC